MKTTSVNLFQIATVCLVLNLNAQKNNLPTLSNVSFQENKGQVCDQDHNPRPDVLFSGSANGINYHLKKNGISYQLNRVDSWKEIRDIKTNEKQNEVDRSTIYRIDLNWLGINNNCIINKGNVNDGVNNYYLTQCPEGAVGVKSYQSVTYSNVYNGIDLKWYDNKGELEYDFIVKPNSNYHQIKWEIVGAQKIHINKNGELVMNTPLGMIIEKAPTAYQNGRNIKSEWVLEKNIISFKLATYDKTKTIVIDPLVRKWGTYYGVVNDDVGRDCETDANGNVFMTGNTGGGTSTLIATVGGHQTTFNGGTYDAFLAKFNNAGVRQWGTYYGGNGIEYSFSVKVDGTSEYISGFTASTGTVIATPGSHQTTFAGFEDAFLVKFDQNGVRQWGTFYGGTNADRSYGCAVDAGGNVYICGYTNSTLLGEIATPGAHQTVCSAADDAFLVKFNSAGVRQWGTYYGGTGGENGWGCATDGLGKVYLTGRTQTSTGTVIATPGSHQPLYSGGVNFDSFLVQFNSLGVRQWGTYCGSTGAESGNACLGDATGNVYLVGETSSPTTTLIASAASHQTVFAGGAYDCFVLKFNAAGTRQWGTYFGGTGDDYGYACALDFSGNLLIAGSATSSSSISTVGSHQVALSGIADGYLANFNSATGTRNWGTYYGGTGLDYSRGCAADNNGYIYLTGQSNSANGISTAGAHQITNAGLYDAFLTQFTDCSTTTLGISASSNSICSGQSSVLTATGLGFTTYTWSTAATNSVIVVSPSVTTIYTLAGGTGTIACDATSTFTLNVTTTPTVSVNSPSICSSSTVVLTASGATTYSWSTSAITSTISVSPIITTMYTVTGNNGNCSNSKTSTVTVVTTPTVSVNSTSICSGNPTILTASGASTYSWSTSATTSTISVNPSSTTVYTVTGNNGACSDVKTSTVNVTTTPTVVVTPSTAVHCIGSNSTLITATGATTYSWNTTATTNTISVSPTVNTTYTVTGYNGSCVNTKTVFLNAWATPTVLVSGMPTQTYCTGTTLTLTAFGASTYTWSNGPLTFSNVVSPTVTTNYTVTGSNGQCIDDYIVTVSPITTPTVNLSTSSPSICTGGSATLTANGATTYSWNTSATTSSISVSPVVNTSYTVTGYNGACINTKTINIGISTTITVLASSNPTAICPGSSATLTANGASTYTWDTSSNAISIVVSPTAPTTYTVSGNSGSCFGTTTLNLVVNPNPTVNVVSSASVLCVGQTATLTATGANTYTWDTSDNTAIITVTPSATTVYTVTGYTGFGCSGITSFTQTVSPCTGYDVISAYENYISIYPNPASTLVNIKTNLDNFEISAHDVLGKLVFESRSNSNKLIIDTEKFDKGVYLITIRSGQIRINKKLIIE